MINNLLNSLNKTINMIFAITSSGIQILLDLFEAEPKRKNCLFIFILKSKLLIMDRGLAETVDPDMDQTFLADGEIYQYVQQNRTSTNTQLFSFLALLKMYIPESYLLMSECQRILGPPDPIHGGPPFEERMNPFTPFIDKSSQNPEGVCMVCPELAQKSVKLLADLGITRSTTVKKLMVSLCGDQPEPHIIQFIKHLISKREMTDKGKEKFSRLIQDIQKEENFFHAISVLKTASQKFNQNPIFPQTIARLYYYRRGTRNYDKAEEWAKKAITRAPNNSYMADTLGQIYKNRLLSGARTQQEILEMAIKAYSAFKDVEKKAEKEEGPEMMETAGTVSISDSFNNRGLFGLMQVAEITYKKFSKLHKQVTWPQFEMEVEAKFNFFEWYLTYSKPDLTVLEPSYFWKDVVLSYEHYTPNKAAESTSFPGLLDLLNHGLFTSKGKRAGFQEDVETVSDLENILDEMKTTYEANVDDIQAANRYILSNIILSNKMPNSPQLTPVRELKLSLHRFMNRDVGRRSPEYYLLVLLLFWPDGHPQVVQEEEDEEQTSESSDGSDDQTWEDENEDTDSEQETGGEPAQLPLELISDLDLPQYATFMEKAFERAMYGKYLRGRYLLPLFFFGKGCGLSKWVHKSRLDAIVEENVDAVLADDPRETDNQWRKKEKKINKMWRNGKVWQIPKIQNILLPVQVELYQCPAMLSEHNKQEVFVHVGGKKIKAKVEVEPDDPAGRTMLFYLGFTIRGPVVFKVGIPHY